MSMMDIGAPGRSTSRRSPTRSRSTSCCATPHRSCTWRTWACTSSAPTPRCARCSTTRRSSRRASTPSTIGQVRPLIPLQIDPPEHRNFRKLLDPIFAPKRIALLEDRTRALVRDLVAAVADDGRLQLPPRRRRAAAEHRVPAAPRSAAVAHHGVRRAEGRHHPTARQDAQGARGDGQRDRREDLRRPRGGARRARQGADRTT